MKIIYVITRSDVIGGASMHLLDLALAAQRAGHEVAILVGGNGVFLRSAQERDLHCISLHYMVREIKIISDIRGFFELRMMLGKFKPDLVHLHSTKAGILGRLAARSLSIPSVFTAHGWAFTEGVSGHRRKVYCYIERLIARLTTRIIAVSNYDRELALSMGVGTDNMISMVHNGVPDIELIRERSRVVRMIMVARFDRPKNQLDLLQALAHIKSLPWELEFVGDGPLLAPCKAAADTLGIGERIVFAGSLSDVSSRMNKADIFLLISSWEGLPLTVLEAMRAGLPVIASRVGGVPEAVDEGVTGFLVDRGDTERLVSSVTKLVESDFLRKNMGEHGREKYKSEFTLDRMVNKTFAVYNDAVQGTSQL